MKSIKIFFLTILSILLTNCSENVQEQYLIVGTSADNPPYEFIQDNEIVGLDIDLINAIGKQLEKKVIIKNLDFPALLPALLSKNIDLIVAGIDPTTERELHVDFSNPYLTTEVSILYRAEDAFKCEEDLKEKVIGAGMGTTWLRIANDLSQKVNIKVVSLATNLMLVEELKAKAIDAVILETVQSKKFMENNASFNRFLLNNFSSQFAIAMHKNSPYKKNIDEALKTLKENGIIDAIKEKWLSQ